MLSTPVRTLRRLLAATATLTLAVGLAGAAPASATDRDPTGGEPLPGYTIENPPLAPLVVGGTPTTVRQGVHRHAAYIIEVPARWNGDLVVWAHGYRGQGTVLSPEPPAFGLRERLLEQGTRGRRLVRPERLQHPLRGAGHQDLADHFGRAVRRPQHTYLAGVSMGGYVIGRSLEQYPVTTTGAADVRVLGDQTLSTSTWTTTWSRRRSPVPAYPTPADYLTNAVPRIQVALGLAGLTRPGRTPPPTGVSSCGRSR
ncbi:hypothetical protein NKG94_12940 [Micromonospora sp. M12]